MFTACFSRAEEILKAFIVAGQPSDGTMIGQPFPHYSARKHLMFHSRLDTLNSEWMQRVRFRADVMVGVMLPLSGNEVTIAQKWRHTPTTKLHDVL